MLTAGDLGEAVDAFDGNPDLFLAAGGSPK
jgi:hypothetical protein